MSSIHYHHLHSVRSSLVLSCPDDGLPAIIYWGAKLPEHTDTQALGLLHSKPAHGGTLDNHPPLSLVPEAGRGFLGAAGLEGQADRKHWAGQLQTQAISQPNPGTLICDARDPVSGLALNLTLTLDGATDVLCARGTLTNRGDSTFMLDRLGLSFPLPARADELMTFHGRWIQEFLTERKAWPKDRLVRENRRGRTSHDSFPGIIAGVPGFQETRGEVWGLHLAWSGNHQLVAEKTSLGERHIQLGEWFYPGEIALAPGDSYQTPEVIGTWSDQGLNGLSQGFHQYVRQQILAPEIGQKPRPVHLNTWEGIYFDHQPEQLKAMVREAAAVGVERFILDDGWFGKRDDDTSGLGDWFVDESKHPGGLGYLVDAVTQAGMEFGLWFEPEMVNADSDLYRAHPDWVLAVSGYDQPLGRHQYVLNLSRPEVSDYLFERLDNLLRTYDIRYIKWDMNRDLTQPGNAAGQASAHTQTLAVYALLARVRTAHPEVEIESCASGGGRVDMGILRHTQRVWTSDCIDALERQRMQRSFSYFFPPEINGSHISANPNHTTGRRHSLGFRLITALFGHMGLELDVVSMTAAEKAQTRELVDIYKRHRTLLHSGHTTRLDTADEALQAYGVVAADRSKALFAAATLALPKQMLLPPLQLSGLDSDRLYQLKLWLPPEAAGPSPAPSVLQAQRGGTFSGALLMQAGLQLPVLNPEAALLLELEARD
ncbi:alpha-galactosidase [Natronospirillum operosum]|uniref:Alpha-galactosidase n=1 Tax=Natronospirillum operosum TaxID=2759953 RepID=A0A4Z0WI78_9GAMM|nr:alpha-galactosidase [Natronospirillum operosum]TGG95466.1 alpha-galactosidase [Natronospirillum operosum]